MAKKTRQQRRAQSRAPLRRKRRGGTTFWLVMLALLLGGGVLVAVSKTNPPPLVRGAIAGEHWHASLKMFICGKRVTNFPTVEGELHSHADGFLHIHPSTEAATGDRANLGTFLATYETTFAADAEGKRVLSFPDGTSYSDGDRCGKDPERQEFAFTNKGRDVAGDPSSFIPHNGDAIEIRFGPQGKGTLPNPYAKAKGIPDPGVAGGDEPAPDGGSPEPD